MLINLILSHAKAEADASNWQAVAEKINEKNIAVRNPKLWTIGDLTAEIGTEGAAAVAYTIEKAGVGDNPQAALFRGAFLAVNNNGLQLHTDERQLMIDQLAVAGGWPDVLKVKVKEAGLKWLSLADQNGLGTVTVEQVQSAYQSYLDDQAAEQERQDKIRAKSEIMSDFYSLFNSSVASYIDNNEVITKASIAQKLKDVASSLEA